MHVIDIPHDCPVDIVTKILDKSNMVILHSWQSETETTKEMKRIKKQYNLPVIGLIRDCKEHNSLKNLQNNSIADERPQKIINLSNKEPYSQQIAILKEQIFNFTEVKLKNNKLPHKIL